MISNVHNRETHTFKEIPRYPQPRLWCIPSRTGERPNPPPRSNPSFWNSFKIAAFFQPIFHCISILAVTYPPFLFRHDST
ncbi:hypothetical protein BDV12DRAFT_151763 [Aspergillus spectabilis]